MITQQSPANGDVIMVRRQWNDWRTATYKIADLYGCISRT